MDEAKMISALTKVMHEVADTHLRPELSREIEYRVRQEVEKIVRAELEYLAREIIREQVRARLSISVNLQ